MGLYEFHQESGAITGWRYCPEVLEAVIRLAEVGRLLSEEHFTVYGTLIEAWASQKRFQAKADSGDEPGNFKGQKRTNDSHQSVTKPDARLYKKVPSKCSSC